MLKGLVLYRLFVLSWMPTRFPLAFLENFCRIQMMLGHLSRYGATISTSSVFHLVQIFVLDRRDHPRDLLYQRGLAEMQGPAFLAYNDEVLRKEDWDALKSMHDSSKVNDES